MSFDVSALNSFRNVNLGGDNAIANLGEGDKVVKKNDYHGGIGRIFRSGSTKAANNAVRAELLRSLGKAFGLEGVSERDGKLHFSADFMTKLESILGRDVLKSGDFKIGADGSVTSGKPLTQRRISAILNKAIVESRGQYDAGVYRDKLAAIKTSIAALPKSQSHDREVATAHFRAVEALMDFMERDLGTLFDENFAYEPKKPQEGKNFPYVMLSKLDGRHEEVPLTSIGMVTDYVQKTTGQLFHINENIIGKGSGARLEDLKDPPKEIAAYLKRAITEFVMASIDTYLDAGKAGKSKDFFDLMSRSWPCIEGKTTGITEFRLMNLPIDDVGPAATHNDDQPLNQCIGREIAALVQKGNKADSWQDVAADVKKNLVGTIRPIDVPVKVPNGTGEDDYEWKFEPLLDNEGKPVVRAITEADIDRLGEACMETILFG
jgi:hypothetical protein